MKKTVIEGDECYKCGNNNIINYIYKKFIKNVCNSCKYWIVIQPDIKINDDLRILIGGKNYKSKRN